MTARERIIIALDYPTKDEAIKTIDALGDEAQVYKVGLELFLNSKGEILDYLSSKGKKVFLDLKFHDIPNTTAMASIFAAKEKCFMFNVHATGGKKMMQTVAEKVSEINKEVMIIAVTILTSMTEDGAKETFCSTLSLKELAVNLAKITKEAGLNGVVCSPWEASDIKKICGDNFKTICPGVRPSWSATNDQERIMTPYEAINNGCDFLVIGRPITKHENPKVAFNLILEEVNKALNI